MSEREEAQSGINTAARHEDDRGTKKKRGRPAGHPGPENGLTRKLTDREKALIASLWESGLNRKQIAEKIGRSSQTVSVEVRRIMNPADPRTVHANALKGELPRLTDEESVRVAGLYKLCWRQALRFANDYGLQGREDELLAICVWEAIATVKVNYKAGVIGRGGREVKLSGFAARNMYLKMYRWRKQYARTLSELSAGRVTDEETGVDRGTPEAEDHREGCVPWLGTEQRELRWTEKDWKRKLSCLTEAQATVVRLYFVSGMCFSEIGRVLGVSRNAVILRYQKAIETLSGREELREEYELRRYG